LITALFAVALGSAIALPMLEWRIKLPASGLLELPNLTLAGSRFPEHITAGDIRVITVQRGTGID
jgi:hypothetical protein